MTAARALFVATPGPECQSRVFPGEPGQVSRVRAFVAAALAGCPARETLLACVSELSANAVRHTDSGAVGGVFEVEVLRPADGVAIVAVIDAGGRGEPQVPVVNHRWRAMGPAAGDDELAESGRGIALVAALSSRWGFCDAGDKSIAGDGRGTIVWAEATWPVAVPSST